MRCDIEVLLLRLSVARHPPRPVEKMNLSDIGACGLQPRPYRVGGIIFGRNDLSPARGCRGDQCARELGFAEPWDARQKRELPKGNAIGPEPFDRLGLDIR